MNLDEKNKLRAQVARDFDEVRNLASWAIRISTNCRPFPLTALHKTKKGENSWVHTSCKVLESYSKAEWSLKRHRKRSFLGTALRLCLYNRRRWLTPNTQRSPAPTPTHNMILSLLIFSASVLAVSASPCPDSSWRYFPTTNSCYKLISENLPWTIAEFKCLFQGAHHVSIESQEENQFVHEVAKHGEIWTGAAFFGKSNVYVNADGSQYGRFTNWKDDRTPSMNRARRCIKMDADGDWFQSCCKKKTFTVCEKKAAYRPSEDFESSSDETNNIARRSRARFARHTVV
ncbi:unnamed protein product [Caenorhabditis auriculariae]|uniref:C-type lectin domain-containing protein n=1 Tax=Caenorhabditis auriculariae TaxID=2777116 RepID=A0A8S1HL30_9PELO|nr:unnamed protein product [Caenorhabditis auriculariae]